MVTPTPSWSWVFLMEIVCIHYTFNPHPNFYSAIINGVHYVCFYSKVAFPGMPSAGNAILGFKHIYLKYDMCNINFYFVAVKWHKQMLLWKDGRGWRKLYNLTTEQKKLKFNQINHCEYFSALWRNIACMYMCMHFKWQSWIRCRGWK